IESGYRLARACMVILSAQHVAQAAGLHTPPLFEVILPMTESAKEIIDLQRSFGEVARAVHTSFGMQETHVHTLEVLPLFERVETLINSGNILREYVDLVRQSQGAPPLYLRPFCARSDPALNSGIVPTTLAIKWALSEYARFTQETDIATYPVIAAGSLPFRGGLAPATVERFMSEFPGVRTVVIQSAFRYDHPLQDVKASLAKIREQVTESRTEVLPHERLGEIQEIIPCFEIPYRKTVESLAPLIAKVSPYVPKRRERVQHIGLFGYSRQLGAQKLPRAIGFTASCYSLGIPPEFLGMGAGLRTLQQKGQLSLLKELFPTLQDMLREAGRYVRKESLAELDLRGIADEIPFIEEYIGEPLGPRTDSELKHQDLVSKIIRLLEMGAEPKKEMEQAALIRHSIG
ncbi:MAG: phosphoenolpyruvate carboxylase, partial [Patescibacteria group bacterium]